MTKVSIIIPAYNQAHFLAEAIESALGQTFNDIEVVVIDDGSTDATAEVARRYLERPGFKLVRQSNGGLPNARNRGIAESSGEYLCFLDSDDSYHPGKIARQVEILDGDPGVGWVYCDIVTIDQDGKPVADQFSVARSQRPLSGDLFGSLILSGYFPPHTVMIRRRVLDEVGVFDPELGGHADYDLWLRVAGAGFKAVFIPAAHAIYRTHPGSMSRDGVHMEESRVATLRKITRMHPDRVASGLNKLQALNAGLGRMLASALGSGDFQETGGGDGSTEFTIRWRSKLEAGLALAGLGNGQAAVKMMLDGLKAVQSCPNPEVLVAALVGIGGALGKLNPALARQLLREGMKMAGALNRSELQEQARRLLLEFSTVPASKAPGEPSRA